MSRSILMTTQDLSPSQRRVVQIMSAHQFGRIEGLLVRAGQPVFGPGVRVIRATRLGGDRGDAVIQGKGEFGLKQPIMDLFEELERLQDVTILRLEFRHGLPCLIETDAAVASD